MLTMAAIQTEMSSESAIHRREMRNSRAGSPRPKGSSKAKESTSR